MASATSTALPSGYHAPIAANNPDNHGGWIIICNAFGLVVILITLAIRWYIRTKVSPPLGADDWTLTGATALAIIQSSLVFKQVNEGFGKSRRLIDQDNFVDLQKLGYAANIFFILALYASKCCIALLFHRISANRVHKLVARTVLSVCLVLGIISVFLVAIKCDVSQPWIVYTGQCPALGAQWAAVAAFDILTELVLFGMSVHLVWDLQTPIARKGRVVLAFGLRLPVIVVAALRINYIYRDLTSTNPTLTATVTSVLTQLELFYGLMAATIPCLRPFLAGFTTNYGAMGGDTVIGGSQVGTGSKSDRKGTKGSFAMTSVTSSGATSPKKYGKSAVRSTEDEMNEGMFRPDRAGHQSKITHSSSRAHDTSSIGSNDSTKMIIKKEVEWTVDTEGSRGNSRMDLYDIAADRR